MTHQCLYGEMKAAVTRGIVPGSLKGIRPVDHKIMVRGVRYSAIPIVSLDGVHDVFLMVGVFSITNFSTYSQRSARNSAYVHGITVHYISNCSYETAMYSD